MTTPKKKQKRAPGRWIVYLGGTPYAMVGPASTPKKPKRKAARRGKK